MSLDPDKIYHHIMEAAKQWVADDEEARKLEKTEKIVLAEITNHQVADSMAEKKSLALASPEYKLHMMNMITARTKANASKAAYEAAKNLSELRRSEESSRRSEMNLR